MEYGVYNIKCIGLYISPSFWIKTVSYVAEINSYIPSFPSIETVFSKMIRYIELVQIR